jgi:hypothetical protein
MAGLSVKIIVVKGKCKLFFFKILMSFTLFFKAGYRSQYSHSATGWTTRVSNPSSGKNLSALQNIQSGYVSQPASYSTGIGGEEAGA